MVTLSRAQLCILEDSGAQALAGDGHISGRGAEAKAVDLTILSAWQNICISSNNTIHTQWGSVSGETSGIRIRAEVADPDPWGKKPEIKPGNEMKPELEEQQMVRNFQKYFCMFNFFPLDLDPRIKKIFSLK